jgi:hypothetical protein
MLLGRARYKKENTMSWLPTLITKTPQEGYELAVTLSRMAIKTTQPDEEARKKLRPVYSNDAGNLIAVSQVIAAHFQTVSQANNFWRD